MNIYWAIVSICLILWGISLIFEYFSSASAEEDTFIPSTDSYSRNLGHIHNNALNYDISGMGHIHSDILAYGGTSSSIDDMTPEARLDLIDEYIYMTNRGLCTRGSRVEAVLMCMNMQQRHFFMKDVDKRRKAKRNTLNIKIEQYLKG